MERRPADVIPRVRSIIAKVLLIQESEVQNDSSMNTLEDWDSLNHLGVIVALEAEFGVRIAGADAARLDSISAIVSYLENKTAIA